MIITACEKAELSFTLAEKLCAEISLLYDLTGYHPYFVQSLCYHLCERLDKPDWPLGQPLQEAIQDFQKDSDPHFRYFWKQSSKIEQEFMEKLATSQHIDWDKVKNVVDRLLSRCLIVEAVSGWQLFSSVFAKWINGQRFQRRYVGRFEEIDEVKSRLNTVRLSKPVFDTILEWYGIPGIGKTTLSQNAIVAD